MRWLLPLLVLLATAGRAQNNWATLTPGAGVGLVAGDPLAPWSGGPGGVVRVEAPAYGGRARAEVRAGVFEGPDESLPEFTLVVPTVGWGPSLTRGRVRVGAGARVGAALFQFDDDEAGNLERETELAVGGWAGGAVRAGRAEVWAEAGVLRVTLADPVTLVGVAAGVAVPIETPGWLRRVLE